MVTMCLCFPHVSRSLQSISHVCRVDFFTLTEEKSKTAEGNVCKMSVSRGGSKTGHFNTTNLIKHLKTRHGKEYGDFLQASAKKSEPRKHYRRLQNSLQRAARPKWYCRVHFAGWPNTLCVVENVGFRGLVQHLEPRYQLPNRHSISDTLIITEQVSEFISKRLESAVMVSLTTDIWSSDVCPVSLISLTAQWIA